MRPACPKPESSLSSLRCAQEEEEIRPASPKYDERSFFYTTPKLNPARPALQRPVTSWATPDAASNPSHAEAVPCTLRTPAAAVPPSPRWADRWARGHVLAARALALTTCLPGPFSQPVSHLLAMCCAWSLKLVA